MRNENPEPLSGGLRAGLLHAERAVDTRQSLKNQAQHRFHRQHLARQVHRLGARALFEFIDELDRHHGLGDDLDRRLERYAAVEPTILAAVGADRFPASPLRAVGVGR